MSPHALILLAAFLIGAAGKIILPQFTLRIVAAAALALPLGACLWLGEAPSLLGFAVVAPLSAVGAVLGVAAGWGVIRLSRRVRGRERPPETSPH